MKCECDIYVAKLYAMQQELFYASFSVNHGRFITAH